MEIRGLVRRRGAGAGGFALHVDRLDVGAGERVAVVGPSGTGKSTLLDLLSLTLAPSAAARFMLRVGGREVAIDALWRPPAPARLARLRRGHIGYVLQTGALLPFLSARENVLLVPRLRGAHRFPEAEALIEQLGISDFERRKPAALSIGERQRVAIARALSHGPDLVLADEPTASLDPANADIVMGLLGAAVAERGVTMVLVTHDRALAERFGFRVIECRPRTGDARVSVIDSGAGQ